VLQLFLISRGISDYLPELVGGEYDSNGRTLKSKSRKVSLSIERQGLRSMDRRPEFMITVRL